jgi:succinyl-CoA synthetase alpha subunit
MAILIDKDTRVVIQGATGKQGRYHMSKMLDYNVNVVGGVSPGKGGQEILGVPIFDTVAEAQKSSPIDATMIMVPPAGALSAAAEAIESRIALIVVITENVPFHDALRIRSLAQKEKVRVIGPNTVGYLNPRDCLKLNLQRHWAIHLCLHRWRYDQSHQFYRCVKAFPGR